MSLALFIKQKVWGCQMRITTLAKFSVTVLLLILQAPISSAQTAQGETSNEIVTGAADVELNRVIAAYSALGYSHPDQELQRLSASIKTGKPEAIEELRGILRATTRAEITKKDITTIESALLHYLSS
jgi:hypothetical protein